MSNGPVEHPTGAAQVGFARTRLRAGAAEDYDAGHRPGRFPPEMTALVRRAGFSSYRIYRDGLELFATFEAADVAAATSAMRQDPICKAWLAKLAPLMDASDPLDPWSPLVAVFDLTEQPPPAS